MRSSALDHRGLFLYLIFKNNLNPFCSFEFKGVVFVRSNETLNPVILLFINISLEGRLSLEHLLIMQQQKKTNKLTLQELKQELHCKLYFSGN